MSELKEKKTGQESAMVSRRKFLEGTTTAAALMTVAAQGAAQNTGSAVTTGNQREDQANAPVWRGNMTKYKSGDIDIPAYLSPSGKGAPKGAVLVIHEVFGLNDHIKTVADRISAEGYLALAPNFFVRAAEAPPQDDTDMAALRKAASSIPPEVAIRDMQAGLDFLKTLNKKPLRMVSIGWCMGGGFSYQIATHTKDLSGAVIFYGRTPIELVPQVSCPLLCNFGELDQGIPPEKVKEFEEALKKAGKQADIKIYPGAKHGFFNDTRPTAYNAAAARDAWARTLKFFRARMGTKG